MNIIKPILLGFFTGLLGCIIQKEINFSSQINHINTDAGHIFKDVDACNFQISGSIANEDYFFEDNNTEINEIPLKFENSDLKSL